MYVICLNERVLEREALDLILQELMLLLFMIPVGILKQTCKLKTGICMGNLDGV